MPREIMDLGRVGSSIGRSLADLFSGNARQQGFDAEMGRLADMDAKRAQAGFQQARADNERQRMRFQTPEYGNKLAASLAGLNDPQAAQMEQFQRAGNWGTRNFIPSAFDEQDLGDMLGSNKIEEDAPAWATPDVVGKYRQGLAAHAMNLAGTGDTNANQMADAYATLRKQGGIDLALSNPSTAPVFGQAMAASLGKALHSEMDGRPVNVFTGQDIPSTREDAEAIAPLMSQLFGQQYQVQGDDAQGWRLMPVAGEMYLDDQGNPAPRKASLNMDFARALGIDENRMRVLVNMAAADPKLAQKFAEQSMRQLLRPAPVERLPAAVHEFRAYQGMSPQEQAAYRQWQEGRRPSTVVNNYGEPKAVQMPDGSQGLVRFGKDPSAPPIVVPFMPAASDTEQMTSGYASRMQSAEAIIKRLGDKGNPTWLPTITGGIAGEPARLMVSSPEQQQHRQAQEDWVRAKLRKESGAVIAEEEMEREIRTYFPMPWDKPDTVRQKERARDVAIRAMEKTAGPAMPKSQQPSTLPAAAPRPAPAKPNPQIDDLLKKYGGK